MTEEKPILGNNEKNSHKQILKATSIVGGAQIISILIRIVRTKIIAVLLGPAGVGIAGLYQSTLEIAQSATSLGLGFSAVRDVAEAAGTGDQQRIGRTIAILRRWVWLTGFMGAALLLIFREQFSQYAFKDTEHVLEFTLLATVPLLAALRGGQMAILQGIRRIGDMARAGVLGAAAGLCITVPLYWLMGFKGIVPAMILSAVIELGLSWHFAHKVQVTPFAVTLRETLRGGGAMVRLGLFTVVTGLATTGTLYLVRIFISGKLGIDGVGQFQAAWNLSTMYVGLVLGAMGTDYFPRLSAVNHDNEQVCRLVNEQTEIALLLAGPMIIGMICFMDVIVALFYSAKFSHSIDILLWLMLGNILKVISWPMGFVLLAKNKGGLFIFTECLWNALFLAGVWLSWNKVGLESIGIIFAACYLLYNVILFIICKQLSSFSWSIKNVRVVFLYFLLTLMSFFTIKFQPLLSWRLISLVFLTIAIVYSFYELNKIMDLRLAAVKTLQKLGF